MGVCKIQVALAYAYGGPLRFNVKLKFKYSGKRIKRKEKRGNSDFG